VTHRVGGSRYHPLPLIELPVQSGSGSARVRQRFYRASRITGVANHCITSLNTLLSSFSKQSSISAPFVAPLSSSQSRFINRIYQSSSDFVHACRRSIAPPHSSDGCQSDGIFDSLSFIDNFGYASHSRSNVVPLIASKVSLPSTVGSVELTSLLPPELTLRYNDPSQCIRDLSSLPSNPPAISSVAGSRVEYTRLIRRMLGVGMVPILHPKVINGVFCVPKDGTDSLRLIIDARSANERFVDPPHIELPTPDLLSRLVTDRSRPLFVAKADLDNFYHRLRLPEWMRPYFALPAVRAGEVGLSGSIIVLEGHRITLRSSDIIYPACVTLPMGWSHSVFVAQRAHEHLIDTRRVASVRPYQFGERF